jgi:desulfoferrodoxin (superoxide reductase-like protein)
MKLVMLFLLLAVLPIFAHPPKSVELTYDSNTGILNVEIIHNVNDPSKHYVVKVRVELNGKTIIEQNFKSQVDNEKQQVLYKIIDAKERDKLAVEAHCNISGKNKAELEVTTPRGNQGGQ